MLLEHYKESPGYKIFIVNGNCFMLLPELPLSLHNQKIILPVQLCPVYLCVCVSVYVSSKVFIGNGK